MTEEKTNALEETKNQGSEVEENVSDVTPKVGIVEITQPEANFLLDLIKLHLPNMKPGTLAPVDLLRLKILNSFK